MSHHAFENVLVYLRYTVLLQFVRRDKALLLLHCLETDIFLYRVLLSV